MQATLTSSGYHPFRPGELTHTDKRGQHYRLCAECGLDGRARRHRDPEIDRASDRKHAAAFARRRAFRELVQRAAELERARPQVEPEPQPEPEQGPYVDHAFQPGGPELLRGGRHGPMHVRGCAACGGAIHDRKHWTLERSRAASAKQSASRLALYASRRAASAQELPPPELVGMVDPRREVAPADAKQLPRVADWRLSMLRLALDMTLEGPPLSFALRRALLDARGALRSELHGIPATAAGILELVPQVEELPRRELEPLARPGPADEHSARARALGRKIRDERVRAIVERAVAHGWQWRVTGTGHVALSGPAGERLVAPATPSDHRAWLNLRAQAKRAGLDVAGL